MAQVKTKPKWRPSQPELRASETARTTAELQAARIPWPQLLKARELYVKWQAFLLWVRAIEEAEGQSPLWLAGTVNKHCPGFQRFVEQRCINDPRNPSPLWCRLEQWVNERIFARPKQEGWMDAVGYYAVRDLAALRDEAYWYYCERRWKLSKPVGYPTFQEWRKASEHCSDEIIDQFEMREEHRELVKLSRRVSSRALRKTVERYVEWQALAYWAWTALESGHPLPGSVGPELRRRCPGFLETVVPAQHSEDEPHERFNRLLRWIEDYEFARTKKQGWFPALIYQARLIHKRGLEASTQQSHKFYAMNDAAAAELA